MEVTIKFSVDAIDEIQPALVKGGETLVRNLQLENERLRERIAAYESSVGQTSSEEPNVGDRDSKGTAFCPTLHTGTRTAKGEWRRKKSTTEVRTDVHAAAAAAPAGPKPISLEEFRTACKGAVNSHADGVEAGKAFVKGVLQKHGEESMGSAKAEKYAAIIADLKNPPTAESAAADELDGL